MEDMNTDSVALQLSALRKTFGSTVALSQFNLDIASGELVTLLGPSGCGKTTALRIAAGFEQPDSGVVRLRGTDITQLPAHKRNMGMVFQNYSLFPHMNVLGNVGFGLKVRGVQASVCAERSAAAIERVRLGGMGDRYPHQLSGGQQQRVALARALVIEPQLLLLDEPLSALDAKVRAELRDEIRALQSDTGISTIFVTHDQDEALSISDRICVMKDGEVQQIGTPREIYFKPANNFVARFVGAMNEIPSATVPDGNRPPNSSMLLRPDAVTVCARGEVGSLDAVVTGQHFGGSTTMVRLRLELSGVVVSAQLLSRSINLSVGDQVGVVLNTDEAIVEP